MKITQYAQGHACWVELASHDWQAAKAFYQALFGLGFSRHANPRRSFFAIQFSGDDLGAMYQIPESESQIPAIGESTLPLMIWMPALQRFKMRVAKVHMGPHIVG